jgi:hypothetical protein
VQTGFWGGQQSSIACVPPRLRSPPPAAGPFYRWGWQFTGSEGLDEAPVPFFGAFTAWDDAMIARRSVNPLGKLWPEMGAAFVRSGGGNGDGPVAARRPVIIVAVG